MNKFFIFLLFLSGFVFTSQAQDLIVSLEGDSLNCTVITQNLESVHFFYTEDDEIITRELSKELFKSIVIGFYKNAKTNTVSTEQIIRKDSIAMPDMSDELEASGDTTPQLPVAIVQINVDDTAGPPAKGSVAIFSKLSFGFRGGYANRLFRLGNRYTPVMQEYLKELKSGYSIGADGTYFVWKNVGLGLNADLYKSVARMRDDSRQDAISIKYIGPAVVYRKALDNPKSSIFTGFTMGYQTFSNHGKEAGNSFLLKAKAVGWGVNVGFAYKISPHVALNFAASSLIGTAYEFTKEEGNKKQTIKLSQDRFEDLSRFSLTVGLKFL
jgi:hypothetical protein